MILKVQMCLAANIDDIDDIDIDIDIDDIDDIESADVLSGQYHAWVAFVRCIYFKPDLKPDLSYLMFGI